MFRSVSTFYVPVQTSAFLLGERRCGTLSVSFSGILWICLDCSKEREVLAGNNIIIIKLR